MSYQQDVQKIYIAYYGRPADPSGLAYWVEQLTNNGGDLAKIINAFASSTEADVKYGGKSQDALVSAIYQAVLGREPDAQGKAFYLKELTEGRVTPGALALHVANGVQRTDSSLLENKLFVAEKFTAALAADPVKAAEYKDAEDITAAAALLNSVSADSSDAQLQQLATAAVEEVTDTDGDADDDEGEGDDDRLEFPYRKVVVAPVKVGESPRKNPCDLHFAKFLHWQAFNHSEQLRPTISVFAP